MTSLALLLAAGLRLLPLYKLLEGADSEPYAHRSLTAAPSLEGRARSDAHGSLTSLRAQSLCAGGLSAPEPWGHPPAAASARASVCWVWGPRRVARTLPELSIATVVGRIATP
jgi:hypothetical protein